MTIMATAHRRRSASSMPGSRIAALLAGCAALLAGCTVGPNFVRPRAQVPAQWSPAQTAAARGTTEAVVDPADFRAWWKQFNDPELNSLIERAAASNLDLRASMLRIEESRAQRGVAASALLPSLSMEAAYSRERISETTPTGSLLGSVGNLRLPGGATVSIPNPYSQYQLSADASWEIDLFGRVRRSIEAADASVQVSIEDRHAVQLSLLAEVAESYVALRGAQSRLALTALNLATIDELLELTRQRRAAGLITHIDVSNALAQQASVRADVPAVELQITQNINQLSRLLAQRPEALRAELQGAAAIPPAPPQVPLDLPSDMARRRPDIRQAEANLHVATAQIGVAVGDLFPRLTLSGTGGYQSDNAGRLLEWASRFGSIGPTLRLPIFDRGKWATVRLQNLRAQEAALAYEGIVLGALHEVENTLAAYGADQRRRTLLEVTVAQNGETLELSRQRYEGGVSNFVDVLNAQRALQQNQILLSDDVTATATDLIHLYRALGGGWQTGESETPPGTQ
jgi:NodT family efflux transporter outer membrane factor (OMF) lipoprotein